MRVLKNIIFYIGVSLVILVALVFSFLEIRSIFAGDFTLMNNKAASFFAYFFKALFFLLLIAESVALIVYKAKKIKIDIILFMGSSGLLIGAFLTFAYFQFIVAFLLTVLTLILVMITSIGHFSKE